jgi:Protein of unknown function (DUF3108).
VTRARTEGEGAAAKTTTRDFTLPNLFDLHSAALYLRSQPLKQGSVYRLAIYAATNAYLATVTVTGREKSSVHAGTYNAIKLDLQLKRIGKHLELEPHKKFRGATIWVSDDAERLILRIDAQIFVGTVFANCSRCVSIIQIRLVGLPLTANRRPRHRTHALAVGIRKLLARPGQ